MHGTNAAAPPSLKSMLSHSQEFKELSRELASLALARVEQDGRLLVRQRELLRRALARANDALGWSDLVVGEEYQVAEVNKDVLKIARSGARALVKDLAEELASKREEVAQLEEVAAAARQLAEDPDTSYPAEVTYSYTARDSSQELVTKTMTIVANDADEALSAANKIESSVPSRGRLAERMIVDLEEKQEQLAAMTRTLPDFLRSSRDVLRAVIETLH